MKRFNHLVRSVVVVLVLAAPAFAGIKAGLNEFNVMGMLSQMSAEGEDMTTTLAMGTYNRFVSDDVSVGATLLLMRSDGGGDSMSALFVQGRGDYYFPIQGSEAVPYAGVHVGMISFSNGESDSGLEYGLQGGAKFFVSEKTSLNAELSYTKYDIAEVSVNNLQFLVGVSIYY
jgi:hypothetical protein